VACFFRTSRCNSFFDFRLCAVTFLGNLNGDSILPIGYYYSFIWPVMAIVAHLLSKLKITDITSVAVEGEFNIFVFITLLIAASVAFATMLHF